MLVGLIVAIDWQVQDASPFDGGQNVRHDLENLSYFMKDHQSFDDCQAANCLRQSLSLR